MSDKIADAKAAVGGKKPGKMMLTVEHFLAKMAFKPFTRRLEVKGDPNFEYRNVRNDPFRIQYWEGLGFEIDTDPKTESSSEGQPDQRKIIAGKYIVMRRQKALSELHRKALDQRSARARKGPAQAFAAEARKLGVETEDTTNVRVGGLELSLMLSKKEQEGEE